MKESFKCLEYNHLQYDIYYLEKINRANGRNKLTIKHIKTNLSLEVAMENENKKVYHSVYMELKFWDRVKKIAKTQKRSINQIIVFAIKSYLEQMGG